MNLDQQTSAHPQFGKLFLLLLLALMLLSLSIASAKAESGTDSCSKLVTEENPFSLTTRDRISIRYNGCWYAGIGSGFSTLTPTKSIAGWTTDSASFSTLYLSFGKRITDEWFAEGHYGNLGTARFSLNASTTTTQHPVLDVGYEIFSAYAGYYGKDYQYFEVKPFLRAGITTISANVSGADKTVRIEDSRTIRPSLGLGADWHPRHSSWTLRVEYNHYNDNFQVIGASILRHIGGR